MYQDPKESFETKLQAQSCIYDKLEEETSKAISLYKAKIEEDLTIDEDSSDPLISRTVEGYNGLFHFMRELRLGYNTYSKMQKTNVFRQSKPYLFEKVTHTLELGNMGFEIALYENMEVVQGSNEEGYNAIAGVFLVEKNLTNIKRSFVILDSSASRNTLRMEESFGGDISLILLQGYGEELLRVPIEMDLGEFNSDMRVLLEDVKSRGGE